MRYSQEDLQSVVAGGDEARLRQHISNLDYLRADIRQSVLAVARVLLYPDASFGHNTVKIHNRQGTAYEQWLDQLEADGRHRKSVMAGRWLMANGIGRQKVTLYPIFLFNRNYGRTRSLFDLLLNVEKNPPPYLDILIVNLLHQVLGLSHTELHALFGGNFGAIARQMNVLFADRDGKFERWLLKTGDRQKLRFYGGETNTFLGLYDSIAADPETGFRDINREASRRYDLGGGFGTADMERLLGQSLVSADIMEPRMERYDPELVIQTVSSEGYRWIADTMVQSEYRARQSEVEYLKFDVLEDSFPTDVESYVIISAGFMTSTVRPTTRPQWMKHGAGAGHLAISVHAVERVIELVAQGKDVDLFAIQRATNRSYKYKTCFLQWRSGNLVRLTTTDDHDQKLGSEERVQTLYRSIRPDNREFIAYGEDEEKGETEY